MSLVEPIKKVTWDKLKDPLFAFIERKAKQGADRYKLLRDIRKAWMKVNWGYAEEQYISYVQEFYGFFYIFDRHERVNINELSTDIFLKYPPEFRPPSDRKQTKKISGLRLVFHDERGQKLFIWGKPGEGKTTFLKQIAQAAIVKEKIPLFISIAEWVKLFSPDKDGLLDYLAMQFEDCGLDDATIFIDFIIDEGASVLLFDGLDEIKDEQREQVHLLLKRLHSCKSQVLITCRIDATQNHLPGFFDVQLDEWDDYRVKNFVSKRFPDSKEQVKFFDELKNSENKSLQNFKNNPLLLSLLCLVFDPQLGFPTSRGEIYTKATRHLITDRDKERDYPVIREEIHKSINLPIIEGLYAQLAYQTFEKEDLFFERESLENHINEILAILLGEEKSKDIDASKTLPKLVNQHGILSRHSHRTYSFTHLTFQEYYTAKYIADKGLFEKLATHLTDSRWREVFLLTANQL